MPHADPEIRRQRAREYTRRYRAANKDKIAERRRELYYENHEQTLEYQRARRAANPEACREATRKSYQKHIDKRRSEAIEYGI